MHQILTLFDSEIRTISVTVTTQVFSSLSSVIIWVSIVLQRSTVADINIV